MHKYFRFDLKLYVKIDSKTLFQTQISLIFDTKTIWTQFNVKQTPRWVGPLLCPLRTAATYRVITEIDQIASQIIYYIVYLHTYLYYSQPNPSIWTCLWQMAGTSLLRSLVLSMKVTNFAWFANPEGANRSRGSHGTTDRVSSQVCHFMTYFFTRLA